VGGAQFTNGTSLNFTAYMGQTAGNCLDSAQGLAVSARLLGIDDANATKRTYFFRYNFHCYVAYGTNAYDSCMQVQKSITDFHNDGISLSSTFVRYWNKYVSGTLYGYDLDSSNNQILVPVANSNVLPSSIY
jgi:hypothetical protein